MSPGSGSGLQYIPTVCCGVVYLSGLRRLRETEMNSGLQEPRRLSARMTRHVNITVCSILSSDRAFGFGMGAPVCVSTHEAPQYLRRRGEVALCCVAPDASELAAEQPYSMTCRGRSVGSTRASFQREERADRRDCRALCLGCA